MHSYSHWPHIAFMLCPGSKPDVSKDLRCHQPWSDSNSQVAPGCAAAVAGTAAAAGAAAAATSAPAAAAAAAGAAAGAHVTRRRAPARRFVCTPSVSEVRSYIMLKPLPVTVESPLIGNSGMFTLALHLQTSSSRTSAEPGVPRLSFRTTVSFLRFGLISRPLRSHITHYTGPEYVYSAHVAGPSTVSNKPILLTVLGPSTGPYYSLYWARVRVLSTRSRPKYSE